jgi:hypothetical protein
MAGEARTAAVCWQMVAVYVFDAVWCELAELADAYSCLIAALLIHKLAGKHVTT